MAAAVVRRSASKKKITILITLITSVTVGVAAKLSISIQSSGSRVSGVDCICQVLACDICNTSIGYVSS